MTSATATAAVDVAQDLYERHARQVYLLCLKRLRSREDAEDAAQTVFLNAFGALQRGSRPRFERAWLSRIAENVCSDRKRRARDARDLHALEEVLASPEREPADVAELGRALATLPESQRRAIVLREWQGLSYREIGSELGLSEAAAEAVAFRARRTLAKRLRPLANIPWLGWLKTALGGSAAAVKIAAVTGVVAVGAGSAVAGYSVTRDGEPTVRPAGAPPAPALQSPSVSTPEKSVPTPGRTAPSKPGSPAAVDADPSAPAPERAPAPASVPASTPTGGGSSGSSSPSSTAPAPAGGTQVPVDVPELPLPVDVPELPVDVPELPVDVPELPVDVPELPVETPPLPTGELPSLPPIEPPPLPEVEIPPLPGLPKLP